MATYELDGVLRLSVSVTQLGTPTDPTGLELHVEAPDGTVTTTTIGGLSRSGAGAYYLDVALTALGTWAYRWKSTGVAAGSGSGGFIVTAPKTY